MTKQVGWAAVLGLVLLVGCQDDKAYTLKLQSAHEALEAKFPELAEHRLAEADRIAAKEKLDKSPTATLLLAEAKLQQNRLTDALRLAIDARKDSAPGSTVRGRAEEVMGKVALRQGEFDAAQDHFVEAERNYSARDDKRRVANLIALSRGLAAYRDGDTAAARRHWDGITDGEIKFTLDSARQSGREVSIVQD